MITREVLDDILSKTDIVPVISNYINVIKRGNDYVAVCPFHNDKNPSMSISTSKQIYKCFACGAGGNAFTFVQNFEKIPYLEAVKKVASLINYSSTELNFNERKIDEATKIRYKALDDAKNFYHYVLSTALGENGKKYFQERNISEEMIDYFSLGFSPSNGELTIKQLRGKNNDINVLDEVGISLHEKGIFTDRYHNRVIFPLTNEYGNTIGFSARKIDLSSEAKYVNTPSTILFNKSNVLYNYHNAKNESKREGYCYVVEGFMDVFSLYRSDIKACVALMGTAFTKYHAKMLKRLNVEIRLCLDGDEAGQHGMMKMCKILDEAQINYRIVDYNNDLRDPDEIFNQDGKDKLFQIANTLISKNDFIVKYLSKHYDLNSIDGKRNFVKELVQNVYFTDVLEKEAFIKEISSLTRISSNTLKNAFTNNNKDEDVIIVKNDISKKHFSRISNIQRQLIHFMLNSREARIQIKRCDINPFIDEDYMMIANFIDEVRSETENFTLNDVINTIQLMNGDQKYIRIISDIESKKNNQEYDEETFLQMIEMLKRELKKKEAIELFNQKALELDEISRARLLDERKEVK